jgi:hypothetical protein
MALSSFKKLCSVQYPSVLGRDGSRMGPSVLLCIGWSLTVKCLIILPIQFHWVLWDGVVSCTDVHTVTAINDLMNVRWRSIICNQKLGHCGVFIPHLHHLYLRRYFGGCNWENYNGKTVVLDTELGKVKLNECSLVRLICWFVSQKTGCFSARLPINLILCGHICKITD